MTLLRRIDHWLFKGVSVLAQLFLIGAVAAGFWQVVARFVLSSPLDWSEVLTRALLIWAVLLGVALAFRHGAIAEIAGGDARTALQLVGERQPHRHRQAAADDRKPAVEAA